MCIWQSRKNIEKMPENLWKHADAERWAATIDGYWSAIELLDNRKLLDLERCVVSPT